MPPAATRKFGVKGYRANFFQDLHLTPFTPEQTAASCVHLFVNPLTLAFFDFFTFCIRKNSLMTNIYFQF